MAQLVSVRMLSLMAGPEGVFRPGSIISVSPEKAAELVKGKYALYVTPQKEVCALDMDSREKAISEDKPKKKVTRKRVIKE